MIKKINSRYCHINKVDGFVRVVLFNKDPQIGFLKSDENTRLISNPNCIIENDCINIKGLSHRVAKHKYNKYKFSDVISSDYFLRDFKLLKNDITNMTDNQLFHFTKEKDKFFGKEYTNYINYNHNVFTTQTDPVEYFIKYDEIIIAGAL